MSLVIIQPDLGTSLLISISGILVLWFAGTKSKVFFLFIFNIYFVTSFHNIFFKTLSKIKSFNIFRPR